VQLPGEAAYEWTCQKLAEGSRPLAVVLAADWTDVEAARHYAEANGLDIVSREGDVPSRRATVLVRKPKTRASLS
jgi:hypothetical protein